MKLDIIDLQKFYRIDKNSVRKLVKGILKDEGKDAELNIVFLDNKRIKEINKDFLGHNYATDVLSFAYNETSLMNNITGEIIVSAEMADKAARNYGYATDGEVALYVVHGLLHLLGYDDRQKRDAQKMHQREREVLSSFGYKVSIPN